MSVGAQVSDTVHNLLVDKKLLTSKKINKLPKKSAPVKEAIVEAPAPVAEVVKEKVEAEVEAPVALVEEPADQPVEAEVSTPEVAPIVEETPIADATPAEETPAFTPTEEAPVEEVTA